MTGELTVNLISVTFKGSISVVPELKVCGELRLDVLKTLDKFYRILRKCNVGTKLFYRILSKSDHPKKLIALVHG